MKINEKNGFTLIELLVVIAVLAIISSIAVPKYTNFVERQKMNMDIIALKQLRDMSQNYYDLNGNYPSQSSTKNPTYTSEVEMKKFVSEFYGELGIEVKANYFLLSSDLKKSYGVDINGALGYQVDLGGVYITAGELEDEEYYFFIDSKGKASIASSSLFAYKTDGEVFSPVKVE